MIAKSTQFWLRLAAAALCFLLLPAAYGSDWAAPVIRGKLGLEDAVKLALQNNRQLLAATEEIEYTRGVIQDAYGHAIPTATLNGRYTRNKEALGFEFDGIQVDLGYLDNYSIDLAIEQPLYQGGIPLMTAKRVTALLRSQADDNVKTAARETIHAAISSYYSVLLLQEQLRVLENFEDLARRHLKDVEIKRKHGVASDFNVLRSRVALSNASAALIGHRNDLQQARLLLCNTLGVSQGSDVELTESLAYEPVDLDEAGMVNRALAARTDLASADAAVDLQLENFKQAKRERLPELNLFFNHIWARPDPNISNVDEWGSTWRGGVAISIPLFDLSRRGRVTQERAILNQQAILARDTREAVRFEVLAAILAVRNAAEAVSSQERTLEEAAEGLRLAEVGYREGTLDQVSMLEARVALTESQVLYYSSLYSHAMAHLDLRRAMGTLFSEPVSASSSEG
jgi:outer membrane protein TolC